MEMPQQQSFPSAVSELWDPPRLRRLVALAVFYPPPSSGMPRVMRQCCGVLVSLSLFVNIMLTLFVLGIYRTRHSIASCTDFCHSACSLASHAVLVYLLESGRLEKVLCTPDMEDVQGAMDTCDRRCRRLLLRMPLAAYPLLGLAWWLTHFSEWMPGGEFWHRYGRVALVCAAVNTVTSWVWYSGPVCVIMLMMSILLVHEALLDHIMKKLDAGDMLPSRAAVVYDRVLKSLEVASTELHIVIGLFLMISMLAFATMVASLLFVSDDDTGRHAPTSTSSGEELGVVLQTMVLVGLTLATITRGARFTAKAGRTELSANSRLLQSDISETLSEALAVQQMQRQRGGWLVWGVRVDNTIMVKIISIYAAGAYYLVTVCLRYYGEKTTPQEHFS